MGTGVPGGSVYSNIIIIINNINELIISSSCCSMNYDWPLVYILMPGLIVKPTCIFLGMVGSWWVLGMGPHWYSLPTGISPMGSEPAGFETLCNTLG
jgi:hypothetical protein